MKSILKTVSVDDIRNELDEAVNEIMARHQVAEGIENGDCSPMDELAIDGTVTILAQELHGLLSLQKREQTRR